MRKGHARIAIILDRSGSMSSIRSTAIEGYNRFIREQQLVPGTADVTLVLFSDEYYVAYDKPLTAVEPMVRAEYMPAGATALLDAMGSTITRIGSGLEDMPEEERPEKVIIVTLTDGYENASREYAGDAGRARIAEMVRHQSEKYAWKFVYLGANQDAIMVGAAMNMQRGSTMSYNTSNPLSVANAFNAATRYTTSVRGASSTTFTPEFTEEERESTMGGAASPLATTTTGGTTGAGNKNG